MSRKPPPILHPLSRPHSSYSPAIGGVLAYVAPLFLALSLLTLHCSGGRRPGRERRRHQERDRHRADHGRSRKEDLRFDPRGAAGATGNRRRSTGHHRRRQAVDHRHAGRDAPGKLSVGRSGPRKTIAITRKRLLPPRLEIKKALAAAARPCRRPTWCRCRTDKRAPRRKNRLTAPKPR